MTIKHFNLSPVHPSWQKCINSGLSKMDKTYLAELASSTNWLPGSDKIFNAFSLPVEKVNYVLLGESPYPRRESANGFAFWDAAVNELWSPTGLSKKVNRATSLRNIIKMLLVAEGCLDQNKTGQEDIASVNKEKFVQSNQAFFENLLNHGFLLLNVTPVLHAKSPQKDARAWQPFTKEVLLYLAKKNTDVTFILLGRIANTVESFLNGHPVKKLCSEHPYNISFITNKEILGFFKPLHLLLT